MSPAFPCICGAQDWSYDSNLVRWVCNQCVRAGRPAPARPDFDEAFDLSAWHKSAMDNWETIARAYGEFQRQEGDATPRERLLRQARSRKFEAEYERATQLATVADNLKWLKDTAETGDIYVNLPDLDVELRVKW